MKLAVQVKPKSLVTSVTVDHAPVTQTGSMRGRADLGPCKVQSHAREAAGQSHGEKAVGTQKYTAITISRTLMNRK